MKHLKVIAFTHKQVELKDLGSLVISNDELDARMRDLKDGFDIPEIFYIATCNRVEFVFYGEYQLTQDFIASFLDKLNFCVPQEQMASFLEQVDTYEGVDALRHMFRMSCSLESLVVGEKEILAQVRKAYERCREAGFTGDFMRLMMDNLVRTAKEVYTRTRISRNPVSVVSLAYRKLKELKLPEDSRILIVGAGETNQNVAKYLKKHKFSNFTIFNRTVANAEAFAAELDAELLPLSALGDYNKGFDVLITCTGATDAIIDENLYARLLNGETDHKVVVDLAIPTDITADVIEKFPLTYIEVDSLQAIAARNLQERYTELVHADQIVEEHIQAFLPVLHQRRVELAMREVPQKVKEIKYLALNEVFGHEVRSLDQEARDVLEKVMAYVEKKYIKVPMVMAKDILVNQGSNEIN